MSFASVSRINILTAIRDHDQLGSGPFLESLGFEGPGEEVLVERGRRYDARALLAYAHGKATGEYLTSDQVTFGDLDVLTGNGFTVASRAELDRPKPAPGARPRTSTPRSTRSAPASPASRTRPEPVVKLCPTCFTQLSVTGTCDFCD